MSDLTSVAGISSDAILDIDFESSWHDFLVLSNQTGDSGIKRRYNKLTALFRIKQPCRKSTVKFKSITENRHYGG